MICFLFGFIVGGTLGMLVMAILAGSRALNNES
jgi:hypothetical protein